MEFKELTVEELTHILEDCRLILKDLQNQNLQTATKA